MKKNLLITGANGQLGNCIRERAALFPEWNFIFTDIDTLDLCDAQAVQAFVSEKSIHYIINCAAYTAVDKAEDDVEMAARVNCEAIRNLGEAAQKNQARVLHVSTDYVFDGSGFRPYTEEDETRPVSVYGRTKLEGEQALLQVCPQSVIVRTAWLYSEFGNNFMKTMIRLGQERDRLNVVFDQIGSPTYAGDLADALLHIVTEAEKGHFAAGVYHYSNEGVCSWYDFARKIQELAGNDCRIYPIESKDYPTRAVRPHFSVLNKGKIKSEYQLEIPHWEASLKQGVKKLINSQT